MNSDQLRLPKKYGQSQQLTFAKFLIKTASTSLIRCISSRAKSIDAQISFVQQTLSRKGDHSHLQFFKLPLPDPTDPQHSPQDHQVPSVATTCRGHRVEPTQISRGHQAEMTASSSAHRVPAPIIGLGPKGKIHLLSVTKPLSIWPNQNANTDDAIEDTIRETP